MKEQGQTRIQLDYENDITSPPIQCPLKIARHAAEIFTHKFFKETEIEIEAGLYKCSSKEVLKDRNIRLYTIKERDQTRSSCQLVKDDEEKMKILLESVKNLHGMFHSDEITDKSNINKIFSLLFLAFHNQQK
ncbi:hypothetical protein QQ045_029276 [Rhodiola kirilowii]